MSLPLEISNYIKTFLKPVEGFKISANQKFKMNNCIIKIYYIRFDTNDNKYYIKGARIFEHFENEEDAGWFLINIPKPKNKYYDMEYPYNNKCFTGIEINKHNLMIESI